MKRKECSKAQSEKRVVTDDRPVTTEELKEAYRQLHVRAFLWP